ncbi:MAG: hypothetical protein VX574_00495 [Myxococcota bacterium]|nr:hypothetical protein [Myxococcota bacterium]
MPAFVPGLRLVHAACVYAFRASGDEKWMTLPMPMFLRSCPPQGFARSATLAHHGGVPHAVIVGGGPAGAAFIGRLARQGAEPALPRTPRTLSHGFRAVELRA